MLFLAERVLAVSRVSLTRVTASVHRSRVNLTWHVLISSIYFLAGREFYLFF